jgi:hypothetical protein
MGAKAKAKAKEQRSKGAKHGDGGIARFILFTKGADEKKKKRE